MIMKKTELAQINERIESNFEKGISSVRVGQTLRDNILGALQKTTKELINEIKSDLTFSNQIRADVGINIHKHKQDPVPMLERNPVEFFMNEGQRIDNLEDSDEASELKRDPAAVEEMNQKKKLKYELKQRKFKDLVYMLEKEEDLTTKNDCAEIANFLE